MDYLLDTNIIIIYSRDNQIAREIERKYAIFNGINDLYISIVTLGELDSFIK
jgi:predicted nucleic acid-binding protein